MIYREKRKGPGAKGKDPRDTHRDWERIHCKTLKKQAER